MIKITKFLGTKCPNCGYAKLNVIKELELNIYECKCEKCGEKSISNTITNKTILIE